MVWGERRYPGEFPEWNDINNVGSLGNSPQIGIAEIPFTSYVSFSEAPKEGAGTFRTSINLTAGKSDSVNFFEDYTVYWEISGINSDDLLSGQLSGEGKIVNGKLELEHSLKKDADTSEYFEVSIYSDNTKAQQIGTTKVAEIVEADTTAPTLLSATAASSNKLILTFSEEVVITGGGKINPACLVVNVDGKSRQHSKYEVQQCTLPADSNSYELIIYVTGSSLLGASTISFAYNSPLENATEGFITDLSANQLAPIQTRNINSFFSSASINKNSLGGAYQNLTFSGTSDFFGYGNNNNNFIHGNSGNNTLDGQSGADSMEGGKGNDRYIVENVGDNVTELESEGTDIVESSISYTLGPEVESLILTGTLAIDGVGNSLDNNLTGNAASNILDGGEGSDKLTGGKGNDTYIVGAIGDVILEKGATTDYDTVQSSITWTLGSSLESLTLTGTLAINGTGNSLNNTIIGNTAGNVLDGGTGGKDLLKGNAGADIFRFSSKPSGFSSSSADNITDFSSDQSDKIQFAKKAFGITASVATLSVVSSSSAMSTALAGNSIFVYNSSSGELYWNENGVSSGSGKGGIVAVLDNKALLSGENLALV